MPFRARELKAALWVWAVHTVSGVSECLLSRETGTVMAATAASQTRVNHAMPYHATLCIFDGESIHSVLQPLTPQHSVSQSLSRRHVLAGVTDEEGGGRTRKHLQELRVAVESWAPISLSSPSGTPARPSLPTQGTRVLAQCHSAAFCLSCLAPQGAFRLVRSSQVASCMHHPDNPPAPLANHQGPLPPWTPGPPPNPPVDRPSPSPARPRPTNTRSVPSSFRLSSSLTSTTTCHLQSLCPTTPNPTYLTWPLSPSHIHQTHTTTSTNNHRYLEPSPTSEKPKEPSKVTNSIII